MQTTELQLIISAQNKATAELQKLSSDLTSLKGRVDKSDMGLKNMWKTLGGMAGAYAIVKKGILDSVTAWNEQAKVIAQTEAVLKSTGNTVGFTTDEIGKMASEMQNVTTFADEVVQSGQNLLLTFTNIGHDIFPQVTETMLDMSQALGQDVKNSAIQLGKALQDPILGVTALRRVGVNFNQTQTEMIRKLVEAGKGMEAQKFILAELNKEFGGSARKQLETFGGRMTWLKNQAGELQEAFGSGITRGLTDAFMQGITGMDQFQARSAALQVYLRAFGAALVGSFKWVTSTIWNSMQILYDIVKGTFWAMGALVVDFGQNLKDVFSGDFTMSFDNLDAAWQGTKDSITGNVNDMTTSFEDAFVSVDSAINDTSVGLKAAPPLMEDFGEAASDMAKKVKDAAKKISDLKKEMKDAIKSAKQDIKDFKKEFEKQELQKQKDFNNSVAEIIVNKQKELAGLKSEHNANETEEEKKTREAQITTVEDFLQKHIQDQQAFASEIQKLKDFQALDEIEQIKATFAEEKKLREEDYKDQLKALKSHLKSVEKEYKDKLKDLRKELKDQLGDITITVDVEKKKKRALGGAVTAGQSYIVGEHRAEVFTPSQSGNITPSTQGSGVGSGLTVNIINPPANMDVRSVIQQVERAIARKQELTRMGAI